ncbi:actin-related protein 2-like isoform X2 [Capsicum annuum]|uniref:actin-related protein 2-like isoform X2 n=1 Tax=Capsicum annuum TaxID=4072 RepID=UPI001FB0BA74|nr:actin-related protein 2-like isoform X2 [Capsicum annuum]
MDSKNVIVCNDTRYVKCGFVGENFPTSVFPCVVGRPMLRYEESFIEQDLKPSDAASGPISPMDTKRSRDDNDPNDIL